MARREIDTIWDRETRNNINENFKELYNEYIGAGLDAKEARQKAEEAIKKANSVQEQFNQVVIEGDSSVEAAQARVDSEGNTYNTLKERLDDKETKFSSQLAQTATKVELSEIDDKKADKASLSLGLETKRDKDVEIGMADLDQEVREAFTGGAVPVVGENSVGTVNLRDNEVTKDKLQKNFMINLPWLNSSEDDLDYIWNEGNYMIGGSVLNNPFGTTSFLTVERGKTTSSNNLVWIKQTITKTLSSQELITYYRVIQVDENSNTISYKKDWVDTSVKSLEELTINTPWLSDATFDLNTTLNSGTYMVSPEVQNNPISSGTSILINDIGKTRTDYIAHWVKQSITSVSDNAPKYERFVYINNSGVTEYITNWNRVLKESDQLEIINPWKDKMWVALGTSMTAISTSYTNYVSNTLELQLDNRAVSGGGITTSASSGNTTMQAIKTMEDFKGLLTVEIGPNDSQHPIGEIGDTTEDTFYGCLYTAFEELSKRTTARVVVLTMTNQWADTHTTDRRPVVQQWTQFNGVQMKMQQAIKEMAQWFALPVIDIRGESGLGGYHLNEHTSYDWIHHTELGGDIVGQYVVKQLQSRIQPFPDSLKLYNEA